MIIETKNQSEIAIKAIADNDPKYVDVKFIYASLSDIADVMALVEALKKNKSLQCLNLARNDIAPEGAIAIIEALKENTSLTDLRLDHEEIAPELYTAIEKALKENIYILDISPSNAQIRQLLEREIINFF